MFPNNTLLKKVTTLLEVLNRNAERIGSALAYLLFFKNRTTLSTTWGEGTSGW